MADSISRLKEILFEREAATLSDLARKIDEVERGGRHNLAELKIRLERLEEDERRTFAHNAARIDVLSEQERRARAELAYRLEQLVKRAGSPAALRSSVAEVIDDVIVDAREHRHDQMARAIAPLVINTVKAELRNNQDEMVQVLYPITGRLVKAYVASAIKDLTSRMNRRLEVNPVMLRFRSLVSGYSMAELALADTQRLEVEELFLIRRGSGALIERWPPSPHSSNSDIHMSGVLAAINDFSAHAFQDDGGNLRSFDVDDFTVYLRASPVYLLAAKCRGEAVSGVERLLDAAFVETVALRDDIEAAESASGASGGKLLADLRDRLESGIADRHERLARAGLPFNPLKAVAALLLLALFSGAGWYGWTTYEAARTQAAAQGVIDGTASISGFPVIMQVGYRGRSLELAGLAPSDLARRDLVSRLQSALPAVDVRTRGLAVLPAAGPDMRPQLAAVRRDLTGLETTVKREITGLETTVKRDVSGLETTVRRDLSGLEASMRRTVDSLQQDVARDALVRSLDRASRRLEQSAADLQQLAALPGDERRRIATGAAGKVDRSLREIAGQRRQLLAAPMDQSRRSALRGPLDREAKDLRELASSLTALIGSGIAAREPAARALASPPGSIEAAEELALAAERVATVAAAVVQALAVPIPEPVRLQGPTARQRLVAFAGSRAIFYGNGTEYRDAATVDRVLDELAALVRQAGALVRIVGYTDERGGQTRNSALGLARAQKVVDGLVARSVPDRLLVPVGRGSIIDLSTAVGPQSPNRRVEFEVGFEGEVKASE